MQRINPRNNELAIFAISYMWKKELGKRAYLDKKRTHWLNNYMIDKKSYQSKWEKDQRRDYILNVKICFCCWTSYHSYNTQRIQKASSSSCSEIMTSYKLCEFSELTFLFPIQPKKSSKGCPNWQKLNKKKCPIYPEKLWRNHQIRLIRKTDLHYHSNTIICSGF